ncbi:MAG: biosynthetic-type acetolactate synthase large subunit [Eggerthellaceae bacterium]|jgi:acetolactate synthase-1/2/3 large subunit
MSAKQKPKETTGRGLPLYGSKTEYEGKILTGAQAVIASLEAEGVDTVFGYPGGQAIKIYDALYSSKRIHHVLARHEQGATHEADGYARATGKAGVVIVTSGPGATNTVTGIATAYMDSIPLVVITGQVPRPVIGTDAFQESDIVGITMPIVKHSYLLQDPEELTRTFRDAFYLAQTGRPGPVLIDIPSDICSAEFEFHYPDFVNMPSYRPTVKPNAKQIRQAADAIMAAKQPVIYAGGGIIASEAEAELKELAESMQIPVVSTLMAKGAFPNTHHLSLGMLGMHGSKYANMTTSNSDLLIAVGARFSDRVTGKLSTFARNAKVIHIDIDPAEIGKNRTPDVPIVGDAKPALAAINAELKKRNAKPQTAEWLKKVEKWRSTYPFYHPGVAGKEGQITPEGALDLLSDMLDPQNSIVVTDVGQHQMWAAQHIDRDLPRTFLSSGGAGTMGFGLPAAIGAKVAYPEKEVVLITGDGSFQMCDQEMATAAVERLNVKVIIMNNLALGMVHQWQNLFYGDRFSQTVLPDCPDFVKLATAFSWEGERVSKPGELQRAYERLLGADRPALLDLRIPTADNVFPMVAPGAGLDDVIGAVAVGDIAEFVDESEGGNR